MSASRIRAARATHRVLAWLLVASIVVQVLLAGAAVMSDASYWAWHRTFVHAFELLPALMLVAAWLGRGTPALLVVDGALFFLIGFQYGFVALRPSLAAALHAGNALLVFWLATKLAATRAMREPGRLDMAWRE